MENVNVAVKTRDGKLHVVRNVPNSIDLVPQHLASKFIGDLGYDVVSSWQADHTDYAMPSKVRAIKNGEFESHEYNGVETK